MKRKNAKEHLDPKRQINLLDESGLSEAIEANINSNKLSLLDIVEDNEGIDTKNQQTEKVRLEGAIDSNHESGSSIKRPKERTKSVKQPLGGDQASIGEDKSDQFYDNSIHGLDSKLDRDVNDSGMLNSDDFNADGQPKNI